MYVCVCKAIRDSDVRRQARKGVTTPEGLIKAFKLNDSKCCGRCAREIDRFVAIAVSECTGLESTAPKRASLPLQRGYTVQ